MSRIRIATRGWNQFQAATTKAEVKCGIGVPWIEIDGQRITDITEVRYVLNGEEFPLVTVDLFGSIEVVYVDGEGEELPGTAVGVAILPDEIDWQTRIDVVEPEPEPEETDPLQVAALNYRRCQATEKAIEEDLLAAQLAERDATRRTLSMEDALDRSRAHSHHAYQDLGDAAAQGSEAVGW